ncbi:MULTISPECIES: helix-turn-helix transcriptional regulator [Aeromonas]|uniref:AlpA family transcriptional regulator n=1 Tax=Aeromonas veronii TaxID=654 RepID=A0AAX2UZ46_AERVE|nr:MULTISPECIES: AlpA family transcriptional regulator [Aeromonas]HDN9000509.1 AlpA family transcriptional regulator [Aeromonas veronii AMC24]MBQ4676107.1 AlpA family phage regulatory protein [Aeromonas hydrophila]MBW3814134.1 AlpA family phage regulatory protein [Aeromonas hydrophila]MCF7681167.1 AlpA family transcriptional regulator [Aeromonas hydrophila]MCF7694075.1 AlpA family transcriptional regulator [Aeromonas hydrophila]
MEQHIPTPNQTLRFIRVGEAVKKTGLSKSSIYDLMAQDLFPKTVRLGARSVAFIESEIDAWMVERITTRNIPNKRHQ